MDAWAKPCLAETHRGAVLDLFPADSLTRIEKKLGLANPAHEFREALAAVVWKYLRNVASEKVDRSKVKRRYEHRVAELSSIVAADSDEADAEVRFLMEASGVVAAVKRFSEIKVTNTGRPADPDHYAKRLGFSGQGICFELTEMAENTAVDRLYDEACAILGRLATAPEVSLRVSASDQFRKGLLLAAASYFEYVVSGHVLEFVKERANGSLMVQNFVKNKAVQRQYHTWFDWKVKNANSFFRYLDQSLEQK